MSKTASNYHQMETAPQDGTTLRLRIKPIFRGATEVLGYWNGRSWVSDQVMDYSFEPWGWAEV